MIGRRWARCGLIALMLVGLFSACSQAPAHRSHVNISQWGQVPDSELPLELKALNATVPLAAAAWSKGFLLAGTEQDSGAPELFSSADGRSWHSSLPHDAATLARWPIAAFESAAYAIGDDGAGPALWRSTDGNSWQKIPLADADTGTLSAVAAGPRGVVVVGTMGSSGNRTKTWHSADGQKFDEPVVDATTYYPDTPTAPLSADANGFLLVCGVGTAVSFASNDGLNWRRVPGLERVDWLGPATGNGTVRAAFGYVSDGGPGSGKTSDPDNPFGLGVWSQSGSKDQWRRVPRLDPGRLPDAGVVPMVNTGVQSIAVAGTAFVAVGGAGNTGAVWISDNGLTWTKQATSANHFDEVDGFEAVAVSGSTVMLVGMVGKPFKTNIWLGRMAAG
ncbi:MAG: hypothetical protein JXA67_11170 [Micromonosporaceae bacterium]|nr:hypothetical protein [Micromonosporaceae bacterium]